MRSFVRPVALIALGLTPALLISACGSDANGTSNTPLVPIEPTSYVVKEPATTTTAPAATGEGGATSPVEQQYEVQAGDYLARIASLHGVSVDEIVAYNDWSDGINHNLFPGDIVLIPPGAQLPSAAPDDEEDDDTATDDTSAEPASTDAATPSTDAPPAGTGDDCEPGSYTITAEDTTRLAVAEKFDVTVEALDAANAGTAGYSAFYPGLEIVIPC
jgi:LysM repeat protein